MAEKTGSDGIAAVVKATLEERFKDDFVFEPIHVAYERDHDGDVCLSITIIFDGDQRRLDPGWTSSLERLLYPKLMELDIDRFDYIDKGFVEKSEWDEAMASQPCQEILPFESAP